MLVLASFFVGVYFDMGYIHIADMIAGNADEEGVMMAFITLNMVEIFHCFNMRSRRASLFSMKKQNKWLWASAALALVLTVIVTVQPTLAEMFFGPVTLELKGVVAATGPCLPDHSADGDLQGDHARGREGVTFLSGPTACGVSTGTSSPLCGCGMCP